MNNTRHPTEALARKAARRWGKDLVRIIQSPTGIDSASEFYVEAAGTSVLGALDTLIYTGKGRDA